MEEPNCASKSCRNSSPLSLPAAAAITAEERVPIAEARSPGALATTREVERPGGLLAGLLDRAGAIAALAEPSASEVARGETLSRVGRDSTRMATEDMKAPVAPRLGRRRFSTASPELAVHFWVFLIYYGRWNVSCGVAAVRGSSIWRGGLYFGVLHLIGGRSASATAHQASSSSPAGDNTDDTPSAA